MSRVSNLTTAVLMAIRHRNLDYFCATLQNGLDVRSYVPAESGTWIPLVEFVARSGFCDALRILLVDTYPCLVRLEEARRALDVSIRSGATRAILAVFLDASILGTLPVLCAEDAFRFALGYDLVEYTRVVVNMPNFNPNCYVYLPGGIWERALHTLIRLDELETAARLLQLGAEVDAPNSHGVTALMMACGKVSFDSVHLLLLYGSDPNYTNMHQANAWPFGSITDRVLPSYPHYRSTLCKWNLTETSDRILCLMVSAGWRPAPASWLEQTNVIGLMSSDAGQYLRNILRRLPPLTEGAIDQGRQQVRKWLNGRGGEGFNTALNTLYLPWVLKHQLTIDLDY